MDQNIGDLEFFAVRNQDGLWFRNKGYNGTGANWVDSLKKARVYSRIGPAKGVITWYVNHSPELPALQLFKFTVSATEIVDLNLKAVKTREIKNEIKRLNKVVGDLIESNGFDSISLRNRLAELEEKLKNYESAN